MLEKRIEQYFRQNIALAVVSGLKKDAGCEFSKVTIRPFSSEDGVKYQFEYTVKTQVKHKNISARQLAAKLRYCLKIISFSVWFTVKKMIFI